MKLGYLAAVFAGKSPADLLDGDIVLVARGNEKTLGRPYFEEFPIRPTNCIVVRVNQEHLVPKYAYYKLYQIWLDRYFTRVKGGSVVGLITTTDVKNIEF